MTEAETYAALTETIRDVFDDDAIAIGPETTAADIPEWDSQAHINLVVAVESRFGVRFRTAEFESLRNVGDFVRLIMAKQAGR